MTDQTEETGSERVVGTSLTSIVEYNETARGLADLRQRFSGLVIDVTTPKGLKEAKACTFELRKLRTGLEDKRKDLKAPILERGKLLDDEAKRITAEIRALEEPIDVQIKQEEARVEQARLEKLEAERLRVEAINKRIDEIRNFPASLVGKPAVIIQGQLAKLRADEPAEEVFEEQFVTARDAHTAAIVRIEQLLQAQIEVDEEKKRQAQRDADMKAMQDKLDAQQKLIDDAAAEKAEQDRKAAAVEAGRIAQEAADKRQREIEAQRELDRVAQVDRDRVASIRAQIQAIANIPVNASRLSQDDLRSEIAAVEILNPFTVKFDFQEYHEEACAAYSSTKNTLDELLQKRIVTDKREADQLAEHEAEKTRQQAERDRQAEVQRKLDEQAAQLKRDQAAAAEKAEADRVSRMSLIEAANDAHLLLLKLDPGNKITQRLGKVLKREGSDAAPTRQKKAASA